MSDEHWLELEDALHFYDDRVVDDQVGPIFSDRHAAIEQRYSPLAFERNALSRKFNA